MAINSTSSISSENDIHAPISTWYRSPISRDTLKNLAQQNNVSAVVFLSAFLLFLIVTGYAAYTSIGSYWSIPAFFIYGGVWVFATSIVHETCHGTAFKNRALNEVVLFISGWMVQQTPTALRRTHARHHSSTAITSKDVEIVLTNPMSWSGFYLKQLADFNSIYYYFSTVFLCSVGKLDENTNNCVPQSLRPRVIVESRLYTTGYVLIIVASVVWQSFTPILMLLFPRIAGAPVHGFMLSTQHLGMAQNIHDHRYTTRSMRLNPILRVLYWNMNYHVEHHMFPIVPFHALPALNRELQKDLPLPTTGLWSAWKEINTTIKKQQSDKNYVHQPVFHSSSTT